jgi:integrase
MDAASRYVLHYKVTSVEGSASIIEFLHEALVRSKEIKPEIIHGDLGAFSSIQVQEELDYLGILHSATDSRFKVFANHVIERFFRTLKETLLGKRDAIYKEFFNTVSVDLQDLGSSLRMVVQYYNDFRIHSLYKRVPRDCYYSLLDLPAKDFKQKASRTLSKKGTGLVKKLSQALIKHEDTSVLGPFKEERGQQLINLTRFLETAVNKPIIREIKDFRKAWVEDIAVREKKIQELSDRVLELTERLEAIIEKKEQRVTKKEVTKRPLKEFINGEVFLEVLTEINKSSYSDATKLRLELGLFILYLTGMRVSNLRCLNAVWFEEQVLNNKDGILEYSVIKKRKDSRLVGDTLRVFVPIETLRTLKDLYLKYQRLSGTSDPFNISRELLTKQVNSILQKLSTKPTTSHAFRYSIITRVAKESGLLMANQFIGHSNLETTNRYLLSVLQKKDLKNISKLAEQDTAVIIRSFLLKDLAKKETK